MNMIYHLRGCDYIQKILFVGTFLNRKTNLGTVHYLYPKLVPKRYGLGNQVFD
jgi:hypothetical protein